MMTKSRRRFPMSRLLPFLLILLLAGALAPAATAAEPKGVELAKAAQAAQAKGDYAKAIALYGRAIASDELTPENLAIAYNNRGIAHWSKGELDAALADYASALSIAPHYVAALHNRAVAFRDQGQAEAAIIDLDASLKLDPEDAFAYETRGRIQLYAGAIGPATADLAKAQSLDPQDAYAVLWLHIARARAGTDDAEEFSRNAGRLDRARWPGPIVNLFLGVTGMPEVHAAAGAAKEASERQARACDADFYIGMYQLLRGAKADARRLFEVASHRCPRTFVERGAAQAELKRLGG
jgi:lipoprotein NlpI